MKRAASVLAAATLALVGCSDAPTPTGTNSPLLEIVDAVHNGGNEHFFFLPPMVSSSVTNGTFDASLEPVVEICQLSLGVCGTTVATFTTTSGPGSEMVRVVPADEHYIVNWHTGEFDVALGPTYRVSVLVAGTELGFADVELGANGREAKNLATDEIIGLKDGRTLPVKSRIEEGAFPPPIGSDGGSTTSQDGNATVTVPAGALSEELEITVVPAPPSTLPTGDAAAGLVPGTAFVFGPEDTEFDVPVEIVITFDPATVPFEIDPARLRLHVVVDGEWELVTGSVVDLVNGKVTGSLNHFSTFAAVEVPPPNFVDVAASQDFSCGVTADGEVLCWGVNNRGQLGTDATSETCVAPSSGAEGACSRVAIPVASELVFSEVTVGRRHACALTNTGMALCWGDARLGRLGVSTPPSEVCTWAGVDFPCSRRPIAVDAGVVFQSIDAGFDHTCALGVDNRAYCWGGNRLSQLGPATGETCAGDFGDEPCAATPTVVPGALTFDAISAGLIHSCGLVGGEMFCWGNSAFGGFGILNAFSIQTASPVPGAAGLTSISQFSAGVGGCVIQGTQPFCWANPGSSAGVVGDGTVEPRFTPTALATPEPFAFISAADENTNLGHSCGVTTSGQGLCWGANDEGQLGTTAPDMCSFFDQEFVCSPFPLAVDGGLQFAKLAVGFAYTCGVTPTGDAYCWGRNRGGQLGDGTTVSRGAPVRVLDAFDLVF